MPKDNETFGQLIRRLRDSVDEDQESFAIRLGIARSYVSEHERGKAVEYVTSAGLWEEETSARDRLAGRYQERGECEAAHATIDAGLARHPQAAALWLRKGKLHWYEQAYSEAYAALTTALRSRAP